MGKNVSRLHNPRSHDTSFIGNSDMYSSVTRYRLALCYASLKWIFLILPTFLRYVCFCALFSRYVAAQILAVNGQFKLKKKNNVKAMVTKINGQISIVLLRQQQC